jgi:uncharacterized protein YciI
VAGPDSHHLLLYVYVEDVVERRGPYREGHLERIRAGKDAGRIVMAGALGNPPNGGAIVFRGLDRDQIEEFVDADPYVQAGLVREWRIEPWNLV